MKIVYCSNAIFPSKKANSIQIIKMCHAFSENGHEVILLCPKLKGINNNIFEFYGVDETFSIRKLLYPPIKGKNLIYGLAQAAHIHKIKPDLVYGRCLIGCTHSAFLGYPTIFEIHVPIWKDSRLASIYFNKLIRRKVLKRIVLISNSLKNYFLNHSILSEDRLYVAHSGAEKIVYAKNNDIFWPGRKNTLQVGYSGHLYPGKGVELIKKVSEIMPHVDFHIIGGMDEDIKYWEKEICVNNVYFHGFVKQAMLSQYIKKLDVCLLPNQRSVYTESINKKNTLDIGEFTSPMKMFDYMACAKAIVSSNISQLKEVLNDNNAILVNPDDPNKWKEAIEKMHDPDLRDLLSKRAYNDFNLKYTWEIRAKNVINI